MKNLTIILLITFISSLFFSCSNDEPVPLLAGTYRLKQYNVPTPYDINGDGEASNNLLDEMLCNSDNFIILFDDFTAATRNNSTAVFFANSNSNAQTIDSVDCRLGEAEHPYAWKQDKYNLILTDFIDNDSVTFKVSKNLRQLRLTVPNQFKLYHTETDSLYLEQDVEFVFVKK